MENIKVSIVIPVYNEEESLSTLYTEIKKNIINYSYEIWFINDGSTDNSEYIIKDLIEQDKNVHLISFRKNFGKALALQSAFKNITGDIVITMDADLQDDPIEIPNFISKIFEGYDLVSGWKYNRQDPLEKRIPSKIFNKVTEKMSGIKLHDFNCGFKAYKKEVIDSLNIYGELHRYIPILAFRNGFKITEIKIQHNKRKYGKSKYGFERYFRGLFDSLTVVFLSKYYDRPMYLFGKFGFLSFLAGFIICSYLTVCWFGGMILSNRPLLLLGVLFLLVGIIMFSIGFLGDMLVDATYRFRYNESHIKEKI